MKKIMRLRRKSIGGFTLIELMIVVAVIGILAAILMPNLVRARKRAQLSGCEGNQRNIAVWLNIYAYNNGNNYPSQTAGLQAIVPSVTADLPACPANQAAYGYQVTSDNSSGYTVYCKGEHSEILGSNAASGATHPSSACAGCHLPFFNSAQGIEEH